MWHVLGLPREAAGLAHPGASKPRRLLVHASALHYPEKNKNQASMTRQAVLCAWGAYLCAPPGQNQPCCPELLCLQQPCIKQVNTVARGTPSEARTSSGYQCAGRGGGLGHPERGPAPRSPPPVCRFISAKYHQSLSPVAPRSGRFLNGNLNSWLSLPNTRGPPGHAAGAGI